jgi:hypothetical protein
MSNAGGRPPAQAWKHQLEATRRVSAGAPGQRRRARDLITFAVMPFVVRLVMRVSRLAVLTVVPGFRAAVSAVARR